VSATGESASKKEGRSHRIVIYPDCGLDSQDTWSSEGRVTGTTGGSERAPSDSYTFPPTKTSTEARCSGFQVASPIHALVSPR
jgi:hypothetical protein